MGGGEDPRPPKVFSLEEFPPREPPPLAMLDCGIVLLYVGLKVG
jgi:hypothetical protein